MLWRIYKLNGVYTDVSGNLEIETQHYEYEDYKNTISDIIFYLSFNYSWHFAESFSREV